MTAPHECWKDDVSVSEHLPIHLPIFQVGGQCDCKSNVDPTTRACDLCKFNTINITSGHVDGCTACACNPDGITQCMDDLTCQCKPHVETASGNCSKCLPNYYGINDSIGCKPCVCDDVGTNESLKDTCDMTTGSCSCKPNVKGMVGFINILA